MQNPAVRTTVILIAIVLSAIVFSFAIQPSMSLRGIAGPTIELAQEPFRALIWTLACLAICVAIGCVVGRLINAVVGLFVVGCGVAFLSMRSGAVESLVFGGGTLLPVAFETFGWALLVLIASIVVFRVSGPLPDALPIEDQRVDGTLGTKGLLALTSGIVVLPVVWLVDVSSAKGQAIGAVVAGCMFAGLLGRLLAPRTPPVFLFAAPVIFGGFGQLIASFVVPGDVGLDRLFITGALPRLAYPMPIDYAAGALVGIALGIGWSRSFIKVEVVKPASPEASRA